MYRRVVYYYKDTHTHTYVQTHHRSTHTSSTRHTCNVQRIAPVRSRYYYQSFFLRMHVFVAPRKSCWLLTWWLAIVGCRGRRIWCNGPVEFRKRLYCQWMMVGILARPHRHNPPVLLNLSAYVPMPFNRTRVATSDALLCSASWADEHLHPPSLSLRWNAKCFSFFSTVISVFMEPISFSSRSFCLALSSILQLVSKLVYWSSSRCGLHISL